MANPAPSGKCSNGITQAQAATGYHTVTYAFHLTTANIQGSYTRSAGPKGPLGTPGLGAAFKQCQVLSFLVSSFVCGTSPSQTSSLQHFLKDRSCAVPLIAIYHICIWLFHFNSLNLSSHVARATKRRLACLLTHLGASGRTWHFLVWLQLCSRPP